MQLGSNRKTQLLNLLMLNKNLFLEPYSLQTLMKDKQMQVLVFFCLLMYAGKKNYFMNDWAEIAIRYVTKTQKLSFVHWRRKVKKNEDIYTYNNGQEIKLISVCNQRVKYQHSTQIEILIVYVRCSHTIDATFK